jgi:hypothetical protein
MARAAPKIATRSALASPPGIVLHHGAQRLRDSPRLLRHWPCHGSLSQVPRGHTVFASSPSSITRLFWLDDSCSLFCRSRPRTMRGRRHPRSARWNVPTAARNGWCIFHLLVQGCSTVRAGGGSLQYRCNGWEGALAGVPQGWAVFHQGAQDTWWGCVHLIFFPFNDCIAFMVVLRECSNPNSAGVIPVLCPAPGANWIWVPSSWLFVKTNSTWNVNTLAGSGQLGGY